MRTREDVKAVAEQFFLISMGFCMMVVASAYAAWALHQGDIADQKIKLLEDCVRAGLSGCGLG